jgi:hypothetical protein
MGLCAVIQCVVVVLLASDILVPMFKDTQIVKGM